MKNFIHNLRFLSILGCVVLAQGLYAQESLDLLAKLDKGLPPSGLNGSGLGEVISYIGDVNNDGFDDWAVGLPNAADYESGETHGKVYIYYGSNSIQSNHVPDLILTGSDNIRNLGYQVSPVGDVNKDGFSDILIANQLYYGGNPMDITPDVIFSNEEFLNNGTSAGDVNHDGFDDLLIPSTDGVNIFYGGLSMDIQPDVILKGQQERDMFGYSVSKVGDVNKDGFDDVIVGAEGFDLNGYDVGRAYVYYGGAPMDPIADLVMTGEHANDSFGSTVSGAGDINNDGYADILVSAYKYKNMSGNSGRVSIYYGGIANDTIADLLINGGNGFDGQSAGDINKDGFDDLLVNQSLYWGGSQMDNVADFKYPNALKLTGGGDYNHDGYTDIITGQSNDRTMGEGTGCVYIFFGGQQLKSIPELVFYGAPAGDFFGSNVSGLRDLNKDGYDDFLIGVPGSDYYTKVTGNVFVYFGGPSIKNQPDLILPGKSGSSAGDVNGDGITDMIINNPTANQANLYLGKSVINNMPDYTFNAQNLDAIYRTVASAGDFNNDGYDDIIIGDDLNGTEEIQAGKAFLFLGGSTIDTNPDLTFDGEALFNYFGATVACAGDVNNDGFSDIMIGAPRYENKNRVGRLYIYFGSATPDTIPDVVITGNQLYRQLGEIISSAGDVNKDGYDDIIVGLPYQGNGRGTSYVNIYFGGAAMDTIPDVKIEKMEYEFGSSVASAGDLNNDGYDDVMIGGMGNLFVYFGGLAMDTIPDIIIKGEGNWWSDSGSSLSFAGDVNKDGRTDLLVGYPSSDAVGNHMGRAYIYSSQVVNTGVKIVKENSHNHIYPNPFSTETTIQYQLQKSGKVLVKIFNTSGQEIETLVNESQTAGDYKTTWHPKDLPNGMYFCKIQTSESAETMKMILRRGSGDL